MELKNIYLAAVMQEPVFEVKVFIVNASDKEMAAELRQGSFEEELNLGCSSYKQVIIPANKYAEIDRMQDPGELDFTTYYNLLIKGCTYYADVNGTSMYSGKKSKIPVLNIEGYLSKFGKCGNNN